MDGQEVFKFAVRTLASSLKRTIYQAGLTPDDIDLFIPHQANARIIEAAARQMRVPLDKFYMNLDRYGNTSAASVPLAMVEAIEEGRLKEGDLVAMCAFGAGLTWASVVMQMGSGRDQRGAQPVLGGARALSGAPDVGCRAGYGPIRPAAAVYVPVPAPQEKVINGTQINADDADLTGHGFNALENQPSFTPVILDRAGVFVLNYAVCGIIKKVVHMLTISFYRPTWTTRF